MMQEYGKYCLDMSKLIFGGVILAGIMNLGVNDSILFVVGGIIVAILAFMGLHFIQSQNHKNRRYRYAFYLFSYGNMCCGRNIFHRCHVV